MSIAPVWPEIMLLFLLDQQLALRGSVTPLRQSAVVIEAEKRCEAAEAVDDTRRMRALQQGRHARQGLFVDIEIEAGVPVGQFARDPASIRTALRQGSDGKEEEATDR